MIQSTTPYVWIVGRTQTNGVKDYDAVHKVQDGYRITPLSRWVKPAAPVPFKADPSVDMKTPPLDQVNGMSAKRYFTYAAELMKLHPPHVTDWSMLERIRRIGIEGNDGYRLWIDGRLIIDNWRKQSFRTTLVEVNLTQARTTSGWSTSRAPATRA